MRFLKISLLSLLSLCLFLSLLFAVDQEFYIDPETGKGKLRSEDPLQPIEAFFDKSSYSTEDSSFSRSFDANKKDWSLPSLNKNEYLRFNRAYSDVRSGKTDALKIFQDSKKGAKYKYSSKAIPYFWNFLQENIDTQKLTAAAMANVPGSNGEYFIFALLQHSDKEIRSHAWKHFERLSKSAALGAWNLCHNKDVRRSISEKIIGKKEKNSYGSIRDKIIMKRKDGWKLAFSKKTPATVAQLFIDSLLYQDKLSWADDSKSFQALLKKNIKTLSAPKEWKILAQLRLFDKKIKIKALEKISRNKSWYLRAALCRCLRFRPDLKWKSIPLLLERQRDVNLYVRHVANETLMSLHSIKHTYAPKRVLNFDNKIIVGWETWWKNCREKKLDKLYSKMLASKPKKKTILSLKKNLKVFNGASPQNYNVLFGKHKLFKKTIYLIDINSNGKFDDFGVDRLAIGSVETSPNVLLSRVISNGKKLFLIDINNETREVKFLPYKDKTAWVRFESRYAPQHKALGVVVSSAPDMNFLIQPNGKDTLLPLGRYQFSAGWIVKSGGEAARIMESPRSRFFEVVKKKKDEADTRIVFGGNLDFKLESKFLPSERKIILKPVDIIGKAGEIYRKINPQLKMIHITVKTLLKTKEKKDLTKRVWEPQYLDIKTNLLGGLIPPLSEERVAGYQNNYDSWQQNRQELNQLNIELTVLQTTLQTKQALLDAENAKPNPDPLVVAQLEAEIAALQTQIDSKEQEIQNKETEIADGYNMIMGGAGDAGKGFWEFIAALQREPGLLQHAREISDIAWREFEIDLSKIKHAKGADKIKVELKSEVPFAKLQTKIIEFNLK
jgi:hypothetical protein